MKEEGILQGQVGAFGKGSLGSGDGWCRWYGGSFLKISGVGQEGRDGGSV